MGRVLRSLILLAALAGMAVLGFFLNQKIDEKKANIGGIRRAQEPRPVPVEVADVVRGPIENKRQFSGTLAAHAQFIVAPKVGGRVLEILVDLSDRVQRGQDVVVLDSEEYFHAQARAEADLAIAEARVLEVEAGIENSQRELDRVKELEKKKIATLVTLDAAMADVVARKASLKVAEAQVARAAADLAAALSRVEYTRVKAYWEGGQDERRVARRYVDSGETVVANAALLNIVELDPIKATIMVTEVDYQRLQPGQSVAIRAEAYGDEVFAAKIERIAPVFREESRQARVEIAIANEDLRLRPGMFVRAEIVLDRRESVHLVPIEALISRHEVEGIFLVGEEGRARWCPVSSGFQDGSQIEVSGENISGQVIVLGQQLLEDGAKIKIFEGLLEAKSPAK